MLDPIFIEDNQLFLTKNGVVLFHGDIPFQYLHVKEQLPTIACNVIHQGRGHSLPPSVTGGSWHSTRHMETCREGERPRFYSWIKLCIYLMKSESQHGSSWVKKFYKTMENWPLALHYGQSEDEFDPILWIQFIGVSRRKLS